MVDLKSAKFLYIPSEDRFSEIKDIIDSSNPNSITFLPETNSIYANKHRFNIEDPSNKVTTLTSSSTDTQYPSAKCVYDELSTLAKIFVVTYGTTTDAEIQAAVTAGKLPVVIYNNSTYFLTDNKITYDYLVRFCGIANVSSKFVTLNTNTNTWSFSQTNLESLNNRKTTITDSDSYYPTCGAVIDYAQKKLSNTIESFTIATTDWTSISGSSPFTYSSQVTASGSIGTDTIVELLNDQAVNFANYGFSIASVSGQVITLYAVAQPDTSVTLKINIY